MIDEDDRYDTWDAAYVLGALSATDRHEFEAHLKGCSQCHQSVGEVAGVPGLLSLVPHDVALSLVDAEPDPTTPAQPDLMLHRLVAETRQRRRRGRLVAIGAAIAAAVAAVAIAVPVTANYLDNRNQGTSETIVAELAMTNVVPSSLSANFSLLALPDGGTRVAMECRYADAGGRSYTGTFAMWVTSADGVESKIAQWSARPGDTVDTTAVTDNVPDEIRTVDIRSVATNQVLLVGTV